MFADRVHFGEGMRPPYKFRGGVCLFVCLCILSMSRYETIQIGMERKSGKRTRSQKFTIGKRQSDGGETIETANSSRALCAESTKQETSKAGIIKHFALTHILIAVTFETKENSSFAQKLRQFSVNSFAVELFLCVCVRSAQCCVN